MSPTNPTSTLRGITRSVRVVPRAVLDLSLRAAQVPLGLAARAAGQQDNAQWAPVVAFEGVEAAIEAKVGGWFNDPAILSRARLRQLKAEELNKAAVLKEAAEREHVQADQEYAARNQRAQEAKQQAAQRAQQQKDTAAKAAAKAEREAAARAAKQKDAADKAQQATTAAERRTERSRTLAALDRESQALAVAKKAAAAGAQVQHVDQEIAATKAARKAT
jgi:colicin import membrane protein